MSGRSHTKAEVIGEAARRVSTETQEALPDLSWSDMIGMRNFMIHRYDDIDLIVVWETVKSSLPPLEAAVRRILGD